MRKARFKETEIVRVLKEIEGGRQVKEVCREYGNSDATYYYWKSKYGGMEISDIRKLKELTDENRRLKQMYADLSLKHEALKDIVEKNSEACGETRVSRLRTAGTWVSQRAACEILKLSRSVYRYQPDTQRDLPVITVIQDVLEVNPGYGFGKLFKTMRRQGHCWNHKRVYRVYCLLKLNKRRKGKRRLPSRFPEPLVLSIVGKSIGCMTCVAATILYINVWRRFGCSGRLVNVSATHDPRLRRGGENITWIDLYSAI